MKFAAAALMAALADATKINSLRKAIPVNRNGTPRNLGDQQFEITTDYSIVYNDCVSLKVYDEDLFDQDSAISSLAYSGAVVAEQSYVLFNAIESEYTYYESGSDNNLYMLTVADWFAAVSNDDQQDDDDEQYCQACWESYDSCYAQDNAQNNQGNQQNQQDNQDNQNGDQQDQQDNQNGDQQDNQNGDQQDNQNGDQRKLYKKQKMTAATRAKREALAHLMGKRHLEQYACQITVDCNTCESKGCFADDQGNQQQYDDAYYCDQDNYNANCVLAEDALQQFMQNAACVETDQVYTDNQGNQYQLRAGFICDPNGWGVQIAMFMDEDCTLYHKGLSFEKLKGTYIYRLFTEAKENIMQPYQQAIDCLDCEYVAIQQQNNNQGQNQNQQQQEAQLNAVCENVMQEALDIATCGGAEQDQNQNQDQQQEDDGVDRSWYAADVGDEDGNGEVDADEVCFFIQDHINELDNYKLYVGDSEAGNGGFFFDYEKNKGMSNEQLRAAAKYIGIIVGVCLVVIAGVLIGQSFAKKDTKKVPLVGNKGGAMA